MWGVGIERAKLNIKVTMQLPVRDVNQLLTRRFKTKPALFWCRRFRVHASTDTMLSSTKYMHGNTCTQVFVTEYIYVLSYPTEKINHAPQALSKLFKERGVTTHLHAKNYKEMNNNGKWKRVMADKGSLNTIWTKPYTTQHNYAKIMIKLTKIHTLSIMRQGSVPV